MKRLRAALPADGERFLVNEALPSQKPLALRMIVNGPGLLGTAR